MSNSYYYLFTASLFNSQYKGGDNKWHNTRYNSNYVLNGLIGKEFYFKNNTRVLDVNLRVSVIGGERYSPILEIESITQKAIVYDETRAFEKQLPALVYADFGINYHINHRKSSSLFSVQIKNLVGTPVYEGHNYNFLTKEIELTQSKYILPVIGYKIEF